MKAVGEAKGSSASAQWAAAVVGAALSSATGGDAQSGANIAANAIKNNHDLAYANNVAKQIEQNKDKKHLGSLILKLMKKDMLIFHYLITILKLDLKDGVLLMIPLQEYIYLFPLTLILLKR